MDNFKYPSRRFGSVLGRRPTKYELNTLPTEPLGLEDHDHHHRKIKKNHTHVHTHLLTMWLSTQTATMKNNLFKAVMTFTNSLWKYQYSNATQELNKQRHCISSSWTAPKNIRTVYASLSTSVMPKNLSLLYSICCAVYILSISKGTVKQDAHLFRYSISIKLVSTGDPWDSWCSGLADDRIKNDDKLLCNKLLVICHKKAIVKVVGE